ncbi:MAG: hypothetical protein HQ523_00310 [Lentisphaerae bacterium]|nr:hypothetical protein [Lentisphaerota bacterium]
MKHLLKLAIVLSSTCAFAGGGNLLKNGDFESKENPMAGWTVDYAWTGNGVYVDNTSRVSVVARDGLKRNVLTITPTEESKVESQLQPFDPAARYRCTLDVKATPGAPTRIYFAGYRWKPGVRPHDNPHPGELRMVYKSQAITDFSGAWQNHSLEFPMQKLSAAARKHLQQVRFFSLYVWTAQGVAIDNVKVTKIP